MTTEQKLNNLKSTIKSYEKLCVAFSGGVDSAFLLDVASEVLGDNCIAVTARLVGATDKELSLATEFCASKGINQIFLNIDELEISGFKENPADRCYICKKHIFNEILNTAKENSISFIADGSNHDDKSDYRPGMKALKELNIVSPLAICELTKSEIRKLSKLRNLPTWNLPSSPCLSSRIPYGETITYEKLEKIRQGEAFLKELGFDVCRVRIHGELGSLVRIELDSTMLHRAFDIYSQINAFFKDLGFDYVTLDLSGFKSGSLNKPIIP